MVFIREIVDGNDFDFFALHGGNQHNGVLVTLFQSRLLDVFNDKAVRTRTNLQQFGELFVDICFRADVEWDKTAENRHSLKGNRVKKSKKSFSKSPLV